jgi:hypothetical protein
VQARHRTPCPQSKSQRPSSLSPSQDRRRLAQAGKARPPQPTDRIQTTGEDRLSRQSCTLSPTAPSRFFEGSNSLTDSFLGSSHPPPQTGPRSRRIGRLNTASPACTSASAMSWPFQVAQPGAAIRRSGHRPAAPQRNRRRRVNR